MANLDSVVDLGLSSGTKWAKMNIGAKLPADYGDYFAWGSITPNADKDIQDSLEDMWGDEAYDVIIKSIDIITANPDFDAATAIWGSAWRMPTDDDFEELKEECEWEWTSYTTVDGENVPGYKVIDPNGNTIFLPAAGYRYGSDLEIAGSFGYYWSSTPSEGSSYDAYFLDFYSDYQCVINDGRYYGLSVRPVLE